MSTEREIDELISDFQDAIEARALSTFSVDRKAYSIEINEAREKLRAALLRASSAEPREPERVTDLEESAWGLIANANEGNWEAAHPEWKDAAIRWREAYHAKLRGPQADTAGEADGWRPIESAPKDGTRILVGWTDPLLTEVAVWDEFHVRWEDPAGGCSFKPAPTHWQPLPPPPSEDPKP